MTLNCSFIPVSLIALLEPCLVSEIRMKTISASAHWEAYSSLNGRVHVQHFNHVWWESGDPECHQKRWRSLHVLCGERQRKGQQLGPSHHHRSVLVHVCGHLSWVDVQHWTCYDDLKVFFCDISHRGNWHHSTTRRHWGSSWWGGDSEVHCFIRPHAGHHIHLGRRLQGHRLSCWVATLRTCHGTEGSMIYSSHICV